MAHKHAKLIIFSMAILSWFIATSTLYAKTDALDSFKLDPAFEEEQVRISISSYVPQLMILGKTYTISVHVTNVRYSGSEFALFLETDGKYFFVNTYKAAIQPFYIRYYGYWISPVMDVKAGESRVIKFLLFPHLLYEGHKPLNITAKLYVLSGTSLVQELDRDSVFVYGIEENPQVQEVATALWIIAPFLAICGGFILLTKPKIRARLLKRDVIIPLTLFAVAIVVRAIAIENQSLHNDEPLYLNLSELAITNDWVLTKIQLINQPPIFFYLVGVMVLLRGAAISSLRWISIVAGSLTVPVLYLLGKELFDRKVGVLSGLLLSLLSYHILYSRTLMIEALSLFFLTTFLLLFWKAFFRGAGWKYVILAGITLGLGCLTKFTAFILIFTMGLTVLWIKRSVKAIFDRKIIAILVICFLMLSPYLLYIHANDINPTAYLTERYKLQKFRPYGRVSMTFLLSAVNEYGMALSKGYYILPWSMVFRATALLLALASFIYHGFLTLRRRSDSSYLILHLSIAALIMYAFFSRHPYYLLYLAVPQLILISSFVTRCFSSLRSALRSTKSHVMRWRPKGTVVIPRLSVVLLAGIFLSSYVVVGLVTPFVQKGEYDGLRVSVLYIKEHMDKQDVSNQLPMLVGLIEYYPFGGYGDTAYILDSYFQQYGVQAKIIAFFVWQGRTRFDYRFGIDVNMIKALQPRFMIVSEYIVATYFTPQVRLEIFRDYRIAMSSQNPPSDPDSPIFYVFERIPSTG